MSTSSSAHGGEWRIAETSKSCERCGARFLPEQDFFSRLELARAEGMTALARTDYCAACWAKLASQLEAPIFWKTRRRGVDDAKNLVDLASLHGLFLNLVEDSRPEVEALRYVVALLLLRKKLLKVVRGAGGARGDLVFKDPRDPEKRMRLPSPDLSEESLQNLKDQLGEILG